MILPAGRKTMARFKKTLAALALAALATVSEADPSFEARIKALEPAIGHYPADIKDKAEAAQVKARYEALKRDLDKALKTHPGDEKLLAQRGYLQAMGHNFDYPGAWDGADKDLRAALGKDPNDVPAILALANLWVNSNPALAGKAELLYRGAQCNLGDQPLEEAQRGLFFAFYYQGKIKEAHDQAEFLVHTWPDNKTYTSLAEIGRAALAKTGQPAEPSKQFALTTCDGKAR
jgi:tetratricopeptide (TPR) repeat protein